MRDLPGWKWRREEEQGSRDQAKTETADVKKPARWPVFFDKNPEITWLLEQQRLRPKLPKRRSMQQQLRRLQPKLRSKRQQLRQQLVQLQEPLPMELLLELVRW